MEWIYYFSQPKILVCSIISLVADLRHPTIFKIVTASRYTLKKKKKCWMFSMSHSNNQVMQTNTCETETIFLTWTVVKWTLKSIYNDISNVQAIPLLV